MCGSYDFLGGEMSWCITLLAGVSFRGSPPRPGYLSIDHSWFCTELLEVVGVLAYLPGFVASGGERDFRGCFTANLAMFLLFFRTFEQ